MSATSEKQEMSMEEILSSIRRYVAEGQNLPKADVFASSQRPMQTIAPVIQLTEEVLPTDMVAMKPFTKFDTFSSSQEDLAIPVNGYQAPVFEENYERLDQMINNARPQSQEPIVPASLRAASQNNQNPFEKLETEVKAKGEQILPPSLSADDLLNQLATPLIKTWLDQHLRQIVEAIVEQEIQKMRKGL